jgi:fructose-bisphosphate aldolase class I
MITEETLNCVFGELYAQEVALEGMILKPNMVISGLDAKNRADFNKVADETVAALMRCVPAAVPGIMFLSGGQSEIDATMHLNVMNTNYKNLPWKLSYSYGRALQASALKAWLGDSGKVKLAQGALMLRASLNSAACAAEYKGESTQ